MVLLEKEWFIEAPWGRISVVAWGDCRSPPALLVPGEADSAAHYRPLIKLMPQHFYYICMELPGCGRSDRFPPGLMINLLDTVYPLEVVRRHFRWERFVLIAHSVAATIGRFYNVSYPGRVSKLIELDQITPSLTVTADTFTAWYNRYFTEYFDQYAKYNGSKESGPTYSWQGAIDKVASKRGLSQEVARAVLERCTEPAGNGLFRFTIDQRTKLLTRPPVSPEQLRALYTAMDVPTLAVIANGSVDKGSYNNTPFLLDEKAFRGNYRVVRVDGSHDVHINHPERVAPYLSQFLLFGLDAVGAKAKL